MNSRLNIPESAQDNWIQTWSGKKFHLFRPKGSEVDIRDIAKALSRIPRFNGHLLHFYSVAQHAVNCSKWVEPAYALDALMHDAAEAYIGDIVGPLKHAMNEFIKPVEDQIMKVIAAKYGFEWPMPATVRGVDADFLRCEAEQMFTQCIDEWNTQYGSPMQMTIVPMSSEDAEVAFLERFKELTSRDNLSSAQQLELALRGRLESLEKSGDEELERRHTKPFGVCHGCGQFIRGVKMVSEWSSNEWHVTCYEVLNPNKSSKDTLDKDV